jgi:hypothetical protein
LARHISLRGACFWKPQIIEAEVSGHMRLIMAAEERLRSSYIVPFGKSLAPPCVILLNGMKLRQIERKKAYVILDIYGFGLEV